MSDQLGEQTLRQQLVGSVCVCVSPFVSVCEWKKESGRVERFYTKKKLLDNSEAHSEKFPEFHISFGVFIQ